LAWAIAAADDTCWFGGVTREQCCDARFGEGGNRNCWDETYTFERCCALPPAPAPPRDPAVAAAPWPACVETDVVLRHRGAHAIFVDASVFGHDGCFLGNCAFTDKFVAVDSGICARACAEFDECTDWSFGLQGGSRKCFLRKSDEARETARGWRSGSKACAPPALSPGFAALAIAESAGVKACDGARDVEKCPDSLAAARTWILAIKHLIRAASGRVDPETMQHIDRIGTDSQNLVNSITGYYRPGDADFGRVVYNNRLIFNSLRDWLVMHPKAELREDDLSLPNPLRTGALCGNRSCYEE